jgi:hypothetical protein
MSVNSVVNAPEDPSTASKLWVSSAQGPPGSGLAIRPQGGGAAAECGQHVPVHGCTAGQTVCVRIIGQVTEQARYRPLPGQFQHRRIADLVEQAGYLFRRQDVRNPDAGSIAEIAVQKAGLCPVGCAASGSVDPSPAVKDSRYFTFHRDQEAGVRPTPARRHEIGHPLPQAVARPDSLAEIGQVPATAQIWETFSALGIGYPAGFGIAGKPGIETEAFARSARFLQKFRPAIGIVLIEQAVRAEIA